MSRQKKYKMKAISAAISEKGGYSAQFVSDGYSIDARKEILPGVIKANGIQVGEGVAWDLIHSFLTECSIRAATTGETVTVGSLLSFGLAIKGWFANKDSKASKDNVRVSAKLLDELKPTVVFSMSNEIDGVTLTLYTVMGDDRVRRRPYRRHASGGIWRGGACRTRDHAHRPRTLRRCRRRNSGEVDNAFSRHSITLIILNRKWSLSSKNPSA